MERGRVIMDLPPVLNFLCVSEQRKEIFKLSVTRSHDATRQALEIVRNATDEPGRFVALLEAMRIAGKAGLTLYSTLLFALNKVQ